MERTVLASDGLALCVEDTQPTGWLHACATRLPLLCLAGLTRTKGDFNDLRDFFVAHETRPRRVVTLDARGRGASAWSSKADDYSVLREADDVASIACALGLHPVVVVGTSRGGILAMVLAVAKPALLAGAVLNDIGPSIPAMGLERLKAQLGRRTLPDTWPDAVRRVKKALGDQFPAFSQSDWEDYARLTFAEKDGKPAVAYDPKLLEPMAKLVVPPTGINLAAPFKALAARPVMLIRGEHSDLLSQDGLDQATDKGATAITVAGEGHAPALRGPVLEEIDAFLTSAHL
ncbi:MAG: alpha/beta hydrolase [Pseudomonadota bacterium]